MKSKVLAVVITAWGLLPAPLWAVVTVTDIIDSFEGTFVNGPVGLQPPGYTYAGYGPPAWSALETGLKTDGAQAYAWRLPMGSIATVCGTSPDTCFKGLHTLYHTDKQTIASMATRPIDWTYPVTVSLDIHAADLSVGGKWRTGLYLPGVNRDETNAAIADWGDNGVPNNQWRTVSAVLLPTDNNKNGTNKANIAVFVDFQVAATDTGENVAVFDNLRITYTPIASPEVCNNGIDDDLNGLTDCEDPACLGSVYCPCNMVIPFDTDFDGDVDQEDFAFFQTCITGSGPNNPLFDSLSDKCKCLDRTGPGGLKDRAVDEYDLVALITCASGPAVPAIAGCGQ